MWHMGDGWGWWMLSGTVMMAGFWIAIVWVFAAIARRPPDTGAERSTRAEPTALEILERRYASGELTDDEFVAMKRKLTE